jgi:hypothetical protein
VSRFATHLAIGLLPAIAVVGIVALAIAPDEPASTIAIALGIVAALIAAANYATNPDWDDMSSDLRRLREIAERKPAPVDFAAPEPGGRKWTDWLIAVAILAWILRGRTRRSATKRE